MCSATDTLELIIRAGAGVNSIDLEAAARQAICVSNCPGMNATAVAELTFALILNDDRKLCLPSRTDKSLGRRKHSVTLVD